MEFEDSRTAIFCDPHAFIQGQQKPAKKVVFAEPYDCLPTFYIDNNFKKHNCDCLPKPPKPKPPCPPPKPMFNFDFKSMMPILLGLLNKGGGMDLGKILSNMPQQEGQNSNGFDFQNLISMVAKNPKILESVMSIFKGKGKGLSGLFKKRTENVSEEIKQTDHVINNYTRVE